MGIKNTAQENPAMAVVISTGALVVAIMSIWKGVEFTDSMIMTHNEANEIHLDYDQQISDVGKKLDSQAVLNECRWLSDKIERVEYEIYVLRRDQASPDFIQTKTQTLNRHRNRYNALQCAAQLRT